MLAALSTMLVGRVIWSRTGRYEIQNAPTAGENFSLLSGQARNTSFECQIARVHPPSFS